MTWAAKFQLMFVYFHSIRKKSKAAISSFFIWQKLAVCFFSVFWFVEKFCKYNFVLCSTWKEGLAFECLIMCCVSMYVRTSRTKPSYLHKHFSVNSRFSLVYMGNRKEVVFPKILWGERATVFTCLFVFGHLSNFSDNHMGQFMWSDIKLLIYSYADMMANTTVRLSSICQISLKTIDQSYML